MRVDIIGGGIGGLTMAIALQRKGIKAQVYEQADELKPVGAGIILANNAMQVFQKLGVDSKIVQNGNRISCMNITSPNLTKLSSIDLKYFETKYDCQNIAIHRAVLQKILATELESNSLKLGYKLSKMEVVGNSNLLRFENGKKINSKITLGADGLNSTVRGFLFPTTRIRNAFQVCWRGTVNHTLPEKFKNELNEAWGKGNRLGFVQIGSNEVYWYASKTFKKSASEHSVDKLPDFFSGYDHIIQSIISKTPIEKIHTATIADLAPIKKWYKNNTCLIGDAAHATTPNMGQGACQAIEDAYILAECLSKFNGNEAFSTFQKLRMLKVNSIINTSWRIGKIAHWKNPIATGLRDQLIKITPNRINKKQSQQIFKLETV